MKISKFKLFIDNEESGMELELSWKVTTYDTGKGFEMFPELDGNIIKFPKKDEDGEYSFFEFENLTLSKSTIEIYATEYVEGCCGVTLSPNEIWVDTEDNSATILFDLI